MKSAKKTLSFALALILIAVVGAAAALTPSGGWQDKVSQNAEGFETVLESLNNQQESAGEVTAKQAALDEANARLETLQGENKQNDEQLKEETDKLDALSAELAVLESKIASVTQDIATLDAYDSAKTAYENAIKTESDKIKVLENAKISLAQTEENANTANETYAAIETEYEAAQSEFDALKEKSETDNSDKTAADLQNAEETLNALAERLAEAAEIKNIADTKNEVQTLAVTVAEENKVKATENIKTTSDTLTEATAAYGAIETPREELAATLDSLTTEQTQLQAQIEAVTLTIEDIKGSIDSAAIKEAEEQITEATANLEAATATNAEYEKERAAIAEKLGIEEADDPIGSMADLYAASLVESITAVYLQDNTLYILNGGELVNTIAIAKAKTAIGLTLDKQLFLSLRYVSTKGETKLARLPKNTKTVLFTGVYSKLTISSKLGNRTHLLGEAFDTQEIELAPKANLVWFGRSEPLATVE